MGFNSGFKGLNSVINERNNYTLLLFRSYNRIKYLMCFDQVMNLRGATLKTTSLTFT